MRAPDDISDARFAGQLFSHQWQRFSCAFGPNLRCVCVAPRRQVPFEESARAGFHVYDAGAARRLRAERGTGAQMDDDRETGAERQLFEVTPGGSLLRHPASPQGAS